MDAGSLGSSFCAGGREVDLGTMATGSISWWRRVVSSGSCWKEVGSSWDEVSATCSCGRASPSWDEEKLL